MVLKGKTMLFYNKSRLILLSIVLIIIYYTGSTVALSQSSTDSSSSSLCCLAICVGLLALIIVFMYNKNQSKKTELQNIAKLVESKDLAGIEPLVNQLDSYDANIRNNAAVSLQNYGIENIEPILASIIKNRNNDIRATTSPKRPVDINVIVKKNVAKEISYNLVTVDFAPETINSLVPLLSSNKIGVRNAITNVLLEFNSAAVEPLILTLNSPDKMTLNSPDKNIRANSLNILGKINDIRSVEPIMKALKDENIDVRNAAAEAIKGFNISAIPKERETIREIVKMPCKYCGTLVEITATKCPSCGAPFKP
jgi:hypothetical protein